MSILKFRSRKFCILLYPQENNSHKLAQDFIFQHYNYCCIVHDKDVNNNGELLKPHTHFVINFSSARWNTAVANELNIPLNYIQ